MDEKVLIILISKHMDNRFIENIHILKKRLLVKYDIALISSHEDFQEYENVFDCIKYKILSDKFQLSKICDFLSSSCDIYQYEWFIKFRPEIELLENITYEKLNSLCKKSINSRVRIYEGNRSLKYATSIRDQQCEKYEIIFHKDKDDIIWIDDMFYIFNKNVIYAKGFIHITNEDKSKYLENSKHIDKYSICENEWEEFHTFIWKKRKINLEILSFNLKMTNRNNVILYSGDIR
jgi:hypothetical protein